MIWNLFVAAYVVTIAIGDLRWRKIPRAFTTAVLLVGLGYHAWHGHFLSALLAAFVGFAVGLACFQLGAIGGGDVKLIATLGGLLGLDRWILAMEAALLVAACIAVVQIVRRRLFRETLHNMAAITRGWMTVGLQAHPVVNAHNPSMIRAPFGVAAAIGTVIVLTLR